MLKILHDGKEVAQVQDQNEAFIWLHKHQSSSVDHALRYEGYKVVNGQGEQVMHPYSRKQSK